MRSTKSISTKPNIFGKKQNLLNKKPFPFIAFNDKELNALYDSILKSDDIVLYCWILLSATTGLRSLELVNLKWADIHPNVKVVMPNGIVYIEIIAYDKKFNYKKTVFAPSVILYGLTALWSKSNNKTYVFFNDKKIALGKAQFFVNKMQKKLSRHFNAISKTITKKNWQEINSHPNMALRRSAILSLLDKGMNANAIVFLLYMPYDMIEMWTKYHSGVQRYMRQRGEGIK